MAFEQRLYQMFCKIQINDFCRRLLFASFLRHKNEEFDIFEEKRFVVEKQAEKKLISNLTVNYVIFCYRNISLLCHLVS